MSKPTLPSSLRQRTVPALLIIVATLLAYLPSLSAGFVWDDDYHLTNSVITKSNALYRIWCTTEMANYWPVSWTSYWVEYQIWGLSPSGYHMVNVLIHTASSLIAWKALKRLRAPAPALTALLFSLHPINVESVAWISQRRNTLSLLFYFSAIYCYLRFADSDFGMRRWYGISIACFLLAMLSKGSAVILPVVLLMCIYRVKKSIVKSDYVNALPFIVIASVFSVIEIWFQYVRAIGGFVIRDDSLVVRLASSGRVVWFYLMKAMWPVDLSFVYPKWSIDASEFFSWVPNLSLAAVLLILWKFRKSWGNVPLFVLGYFIISLSPFLGFFTIFYMRYSYVADHYAYFAVIGVPLILVSGFEALVRRLRCKKIVFKFVVLSLAAVLGTLTWRRCNTFQDPETLWRDTLEVNPGCWLAHNDLGNLLWTEGRLNEASHHFKKAIQIRPDFPESYYNYGGLLDELGQTSDSIGQLLSSLEIQPDMSSAHSKLAEILARPGAVEEPARFYHDFLLKYPNASWPYVGLGHLSLRQGELDEALRYAQSAVRLSPDSSQAHLLIGSVLYERQELHRALRHFQSVSYLEPNNGLAQYYLGNVLGDLGRFSAAMFHFRKALEIDSADFRSENSLGLLMEYQGELPRAIHHFRRAIGIKSDDPLTHFNLGRVLAADGRQLEAIDSFRTALLLKPDFELASEYLERALSSDNASPK